MKPAKYSNAAVKAHPSPAVGEGEAYALACKAVHEARVAFDAPKLTTAQRLDAIGIDAICEMVADCRTLREISDNAGVSKGSLINWLASYPDQYAHAREAQADVMASDILALADECRIGTIVTEKANGGTETKTADMVERARLQIDARKWLAGKMAPKKYGDKLAVGGADDLPPVQITEIVRKIVKS